MTTPKRAKSRARSFRRARHSQPDEEPANEHVVVLSDLETRNFKQLPGVADPMTGEIPEEGTYRGPHQYMHTMNGFAYEDAIPHFTGKVGDLSRWRVISIGSEAHTFTSTVTDGSTPTAP